MRNTGTQENWESIKIHRDRFTGEHQHIISNLTQIKRCHKFIVEPFIFFLNSSLQGLCLMARSFLLLDIWSSYPEEWRHEASREQKCLLTFKNSILVLMNLFPAPEHIRSVASSHHCDLGSLLLSQQGQRLTACLTSQGERLPLASCDLKVSLLVG